MASTSVIYCALFALSTVAALQSFGNYHVTTESVEICNFVSNPISTDLQLEKKNNDVQIEGCFTVPTLMTNIKGFINASVRGDNGWQDNVFNMDLNNWCNEKSLEYIRDHTNMSINQKDCSINQGYFCLKDVVLNEPVHMAVGDIAPLGTYRSTIVMNSAEGKGLCLQSEVAFSEK